VVIAFGEIWVKREFCGFAKSDGGGLGKMELPTWVFCVGSPQGTFSLQQFA
jgi:hypothetical protein